LEYLSDHFAEIEEACASERVEATVACLLEARKASSAFPPRSRNREGLSRLSAQSVRVTSPFANIRPGQWDDDAGKRHCKARGGSIPL
jgi:hypothetical protein